MSIVVQNDLPAKQILEDENIFVMDETRASTQCIRPLKIVILNLMPIKDKTELNLLRVLGNFPIQTLITFMKISSREARHTPASHLNRFYSSFDELKDQFFDGLIITGAPIEHLPFEEVEYWEELKGIMEWSRSHAFSTFHICWGAQAGLYYHHGINKVMLDKKISGIYMQKVYHRKKMMMRGMDDQFFCPVSRYTGIDEDALSRNEELYTVAGSPETGSCIILAYSSRQVFVTGHTEYDRLELDEEYKRDMARGLNPDIPVNYYPGGDPENPPLLTWRSASNCLYTNWLNFVYQETPYDLNCIPPIEGSSYKDVDSQRM